MTTIITHRGLDPERNNYTESSFYVFLDHLKRGYGIEFDIRKTKDGRLVVIHDDNLTRITEGKDTRSIKDLKLNEILNINISNSKITELSQILNIIKLFSTPKSISALHLKSSTQDRETLDILVSELKYTDLNKIIVFDVLKDTAIYLKNALPNIQLAPSVAHPYDIERYNKLVGGTLWNIKDVLENKNLFYGVWLDEWDILDKNGISKTLYTKEIFDTCRSVSLKIFLVTPELHFSSPGLYGGESHQDAISEKKLIRRIKKIITLNPDGLCTDYPDKVKKLL
ncbi:MAG: glycerophosphodiester phosphodiesterase family protein [Candidatus Paceibacterota bacterium]|jgi:glycerophosphoryl diester phosphodiesterase